MSDFKKILLDLVLLAGGLVFLFYLIRGLQKEEPVKQTIIEEEVQEFQRMSAEELQSMLEAAQVGSLISYGVLNNEEYLQWKVLAREENRLLVISDSLLDAKPFHSSVADSSQKYLTITWENSDIRTWLNGELYDSLFDAAEKERILDTEVITPPGTSFNFATGEVRDGGANTVDKLFFLSQDEVKEYMPYEDSRAASNAIYVIVKVENGLSHTDEIIREVPGTEYEVKAGVAHKRVQDWWLRSPGGMSFHMQCIFFNEIDEEGMRVDSEVGIRPAMWIAITN